MGDSNYHRKIRGKEYHLVGRHKYMKWAKEDAKEHQDNGYRTHIEVIRSNTSGKTVAVYGVFKGPRRKR